MPMIRVFQVFQASPSLNGTRPGQVAEFMDESFSCGCHLNHETADEHKAFWDRYTYRRREKVRKRDKKKRSHNPAKFVGTYLEYLQSRQWHQKRKAALAHYGKKCCRCGSQKQLQVHHRDYGSLFHESMTDLEVLCDCCHAKQHGKTPKPRTRKYQPLST